jgi:hypothetical protein
LWVLTPNAICSRPGWEGDSRINSPTKARPTPFVLHFFAMYTPRISPEFLDRAAKDPAIWKKLRKLRQAIPDCLQEMALCSAADSVKACGSRPRLRAKVVGKRRHLDR